MPTWRDSILNQFIPNVSRLSLVSDPSNLLTEEKMSMALRKKGFDILEFNNAIDFRYSYESQYRSIWDKGTKTELVVILHSQNPDLKDLPFDLLENGKTFYFNITDIFPNFSPPILDLLEKNELDTLYQYKELFPQKRISDLSTIDFILKYVYKINCEIVSTEFDLMKLLLHIHYSNFRIPDQFLNRLSCNISLKSIITKQLLNKLLYKKQLFIEYIIENHKSIVENSPELIISKIITNNQPGINKLFTQFENEIPSLSAAHKDWLSFMLKYAYLSSFIYRENKQNNIEKITKLYEKSNFTYIEWLKSNYFSIITIPSVTPAMVHHLPHFMFHSYTKTKKPQALIILDGLSLDQWITLKDSMPEQKHTYIENALFAWVPTLTPVSRQAIVSGKKPLEFAQYINSTSREENYWSLFWENVGFQKDNIVYKKAIDDYNFINEIEDYINPAKTKAVCFIINKIDDIMHGMEMGYSGLHNQIELYGKSGFVETLIDSLLQYNFEITITSDHGNVDCIGIGNPKEASIAEIKGERVRVYQNKVLLDSIQREFPTSFPWEPTSLPRNYYPLLSEGNTSFTTMGKKSVSHGGISMQETIVPFIKIEGN
ncbi:hypothetical protein FACS1894137_04390 [Spirochaetia bacterium]|nr:hypothetical protein FACS1894137_04390 [Spirochaetia bacterium]